MRVELHRLTSVKTIVEAGHSAANQVGPAGLDGIAEAIIDAWPRTWELAPRDVRTEARDLLLTCLARIGSATTSWNGALDELDDETLAATIARFAGRVREHQDPRALRGFAKTVVGEPARTDDGPERIARYLSSRATSGATTTRGGRCSKAPPRRSTRWGAERNPDRSTRRSTSCGRRPSPHRIEDNR